MADVLPPEQLRFLFLRPRPNQVIEFDPVGTDAVPRVFDDFDKFAAATAGRDVHGELPAGHERIFQYSLLSPAADVAAEADAFRPPFGHLALLLQVPGVDIEERMAAEKGARLTGREREILAERVAAARAWLDEYAPESLRLVVRRDGLPAEAAELDDAQRRFLGALADSAETEAAGSGESWQALIFQAAKDKDVAARRAFEAIYRAFLGRPNGPRAGWLLASLEPEFVQTRLRDAAGWPVKAPS
jgi:lysyl-tRNA synthetase class 1